MSTLLTILSTEKRNFYNIYSNYNGLHSLHWLSKTFWKYGNHIYQLPLILTALLHDAW